MNCQNVWQINALMLHKMKTCFCWPFSQNVKKNVLKMSRIFFFCFLIRFQFSKWEKNIIYNKSEYNIYQGSFLFCIWIYPFKFIIIFIFRTKHMSKIYFEKFFKDLAFLVKSSTYHNIRHAYVSKIVHYSYIYGIHAYKLLLM